MWQSTTYVSVNPATTTAQLSLWTACALVSAHSGTKAWPARTRKRIKCPQMVIIPKCNFIHHFFCPTKLMSLTCQYIFFCFFCFCGCSEPRPSVRSPSARNPSARNPSVQRHKVSSPTAPSPTMPSPNRPHEANWACWSSWSPCSGGQTRRRRTCNLEGLPPGGVCSSGEDAEAQEC